jgi:hypothetical protein
MTLMWHHGMGWGHSETHQKLWPPPPSTPRAIHMVSAIFPHHGVSAHCHLCHAAGGRQRPQKKQGWTWTLQDSSISGYVALKGTRIKPAEFSWIWVIFPGRCQDVGTQWDVAFWILRHGLTAPLGKALRSDAEPRVSMWWPGATLCTAESPALVLPGPVPLYLP